MCQRPPQWQARAIKWAGGSQVARDYHVHDGYEGRRGTRNLKRTAFGGGTHEMTR